MECRGPQEDEIPSKPNHIQAAASTIIEDWLRTQQKLPTEDPMK